MSKFLRKAQGAQRGSTHIAIIVCLVVALVGVLGVVFYQNFIVKPAKTTTQASTKTEAASPKTTEVPKSTIEAIAGSDMNRYINHEYGFQFDFPKQAYESVKCAESTVGYDTYGNKIVVPTYKTNEFDVTDITVLEGDGKFMVTAKQTTLLSELKDGGFSKCEVIPSSIALAEKANFDSTISLGSEFRTWEVAKVVNKDHLSDAVSSLASFKGQAVNYTLGALQDGRYPMTYTFTNNPDNVGGGAYKFWYYPSKGLLVYIGLGQSASFMKSKTDDSVYIGQIVDSFKLTD